MGSVNALWWGVCSEGRREVWKHGCESTAVEVYVLRCEFGGAGVGVHVCGFVCGNACIACGCGTYRCMESVWLRTTGVDDRQCDLRFLSNKLSSSNRD